MVKLHVVNCLGQLLPDCGIIGTLGWGETGHLNATLEEYNTGRDFNSTNITHALLEQEKKAVAMEVSSHGLQSKDAQTVWSFQWSRFY